MSYAFGQSGLRPSRLVPSDVVVPPGEAPPPERHPGDVPVTAPPQGYLEKTKLWWQERTQLEQGAVVAGGLTLLGITVYAITSGPSGRSKSRRPARA